MKKTGILVLAIAFVAMSFVKPTPMVVETYRVDSASSTLIMYRQLSWIVDHYGYEMLIDLDAVRFLEINWAIKPDLFQRDGITGTKVQDLGFIISKPNHIIIYKL